MAQYTENYNLELQQGTDFINVNGLNANFNTIDGELKNLEDNKAPKAHKHMTSDITDFPTALPADGGDADTVGGKSANDFRLTDVSIVSNQDYNSFTNGTAYAATGCANSPDNYCIVETNVAPNGDGYQRAYCVNTRITYNRKRATVDGWTSWNDDRDGGNAYTVGGKTEAQLIKYDDLFAYTDGRIISSVLWINTETFDDSMRKTYGIVPGTPDSPPGMGYGVRLPCVAYDKNGVLVTVIQLDPVENQGKVWTNLYRKHLGSWTGWRANNDGGNAYKLDGKTADNFAQYISNALYVKRQDGDREGGQISLESPITSTLTGAVHIDVLEDDIRIFGATSSGIRTIQTNIAGLLPSNYSLTVHKASTSDIHQNVTNIGKNALYIVYE